MLARCPSCRNTFSTERTGRMDCPVCGKPLFVPEAPLPPPAGQELVPAPGAGGPAGGEADGGAQGTAWERRRELPSAWAAWTMTVGQALLEPGKLFGEARLDRGGAQLGFALLTSTAGSVVGHLLWLLFARDGAQLQQFLRQMAGERPFPPELEGLLLRATTPAAALASTLVSILLAPLVLLVFLYASAGVTHLFAMLFGQNLRGFPATFAAVAYSFTPMLLLALPGCGWLVALVWCAVLTCIGMKHTHGISSGGAVAASLSPYLLVCCASCAVFGLIGFAASRMPR